MATKRPRKANYSREENIFLADKYGEFKDIIDAKQKDACTNKRKRDVWAAILIQHRARFRHIERTVDDMKLRLSKLKAGSKECLSSMKRTKKATWGGREQLELNAAEQNILDLSRDSGTPGFKELAGVYSAVGPRTREVQEEDEQNGGESNGPHCTRLTIDGNSAIDGNYSGNIARQPIKLKVFKEVDIGSKVTINGIDQDKVSADADGTGEQMPPASRSSESFIPASTWKRQQQRPLLQMDVMDIERDNAFIKRENLLLKHKKLQLQIELLKHKLGQSTAGDGEEVLMSV